jgi:hypothetical protein
MFLSLTQSNAKENQAQAGGQALKLQVPFSSVSHVKNAGRGRGRFFTTEKPK